MAKNKSDKASVDCSKCLFSIYSENITYCSLRLKDINVLMPSGVVISATECVWFRAKG